MLTLLSLQTFSLLIHSHSDSLSCRCAKVCSVSHTRTHIHTHITLTFLVNMSSLTLLPERLSKTSGRVAGAHLLLIRTLEIDVGERMLILDTCGAVRRDDVRRTRTMVIGPVLCRVLTCERTELH